ncbi:hypothetical protein Tco_1302372 [Tanacetum coccineum]
MVKDKSISIRNRINLHTVRDDSLLGSLKYVSKTKDYQKYEALIPDGIINQDIKDSTAYKPYYDFATGKVAPKKVAICLLADYWFAKLYDIHLGIVAMGLPLKMPLCVPLFSVPKPCSACSKVFLRDIYDDHVLVVDMSFITKNPNEGSFRVGSPSVFMNNNDVDAIPTQPVASAQPSQLVENTADSKNSR